MGLEILSILNAKTVKFDTGTGGSPAIVQSDVAAALSCLDSFNSNILRMKYAGQDELMVKVVLEVVRVIVEKCTLEKWDVRLDGRKVNPIVAISREAVYEWMDGKCTTCKGTGEKRSRSGQVVICDRCGGLGLRPKSSRGRAKACGISHTSFAQTWEDRYEWVLDFMKNEESLAITEFSRAMR